jgi:hypothetical protein
MENNLLEAALSARRHNVSTVAVDLPAKTPPPGLSWKWRQKKPPDERTIRADLAGRNGSSGFAVIAGAVSGNVEAFDFDLSGEFYPAWAALVEAEAPGLLGRMAKQKTMSGGVHVIARCPGTTIPGSRKLARKRVEVKGPGEHEHGGKRYTARQYGGKWFIFPGAIETKAEGGYFVVAPSPGYEVTQTPEGGEFFDFPEITPTEREILLRCARALDELPPERVEDGPKHTALKVGGLRPGEDYNQRGNVLEILLKHGCKLAGGTPERQQLTRAGKERGISATLYDGRTLRVFSSNAPPFEEDTNYSAFAVYALLECGGDFSKAAAELGRQGFGDPPRAKEEAPRSDPEPKPDQDPRPEEPPTETIQPAGIIRAVLTVGQFMEIQTPPRRYHLEGWLKECSIGMIDSPAGFGKTGLVHGILNTVSKGGTFGPWRCNYPAAVGIVDGEMSIEDNRERIELEGLADDRECPFYLYSDAYAYSLGCNRARLTDENWRREFKELLLDLDVKLCAFDNIASLAPGLDENAKKDWDPVNQWLIDLRFAGVSSLLIHHDNKTGGQRGTSARTDNLDYVIQLRQPADYMPEDGARFIVHFTKARVENRFLPLVADIEMQLTQDPGGRYVWTFKSVKAARKREVVRLLDEGLKNKDIAAAVGYSAGAVSKIRTWAVQEGLFSKAGKLTPSGFEWLSKG